jgi:hypothetical protein
MYLINTDLEEVTKEFDFVNSWIDTVCKNILKKEKEDCKIVVYYNYGYFVPKGKGANPDQYFMTFDERVDYEFSKVRVNITLKIDDLMLTNRLSKGDIPSIIKSIVTEITKYKMEIEFEFHKNQKIKDSIPPFDNSIVAIETIQQEINVDKIEEDYFDLDSILDKISKNGIESLTDGEKKFLDKKSKEM